MIEPHSQQQLKQAIVEQIALDRELLDRLRADVRPLKTAVRRVQPRATTSISLVGTDGGNNRLEFDPFLVQIIRVVDSSNNELCLEAVTPTTSVTQLSAKQFNGDGTPVSALGELMTYLGIRDLTTLSHMIRSTSADRPVSPSWVQVYRELVEWAVLFSIVRTKDFGTDTLIVFDGLLRSKVFAGDFFGRYLNGLMEGIARHAHQHRRLYLAGVAKHSKVLARYRLAMNLEGILTCDYPAYVEVPRQLERNTYLWDEYARGDDAIEAGGEINRYVGGKMFFVKFGGGARDPIWPIDIFLPQVGEAQVILGSMLADAINGFPVPFYPLCLQRAHENAALVDFDFDILQDHIFDAIRGVLGHEAPVLDAFRLQDADPAGRRYA